MFYLTYDEFHSSSAYYALLPYYPASEQPGCSVPVDKPVEDVMDYAAPDGGTTI